MVTECGHGVGNLLPTFNRVFEYRPIALEMLTQPNRFKKAERNLLADEKCPRQLEQHICLDYKTIRIHLLGKDSFKGLSLCV